MTNYVRRLTSDVIQDVERCDTIIPNSNYIALIFDFISKTPIKNECMQALLSHLLQDKDQSRVPTIIYTYKNTAIIIIAAKEGKSTHCAGGSMQRLISTYTHRCKQSLEKHVDNIECTCYFTPYQNKIYSFLCIKMFNNIRHSVLVFGGMMDQLKKLENTSLSEICAKIKKEQNKDWLKLPPEERYGQFHRLENKKVKSFSQLLDFENMDDNITLLFS